MDDRSGRVRNVHERLRDLVDTYRRVHARYRRMATLSEEAVTLLQSEASLQSVNSMLSEKKVLLEEVREEEERVTGDREWWKRSRASLPAEDCRELLSLLDSISRSLEDTLAREEECRVLLREKASWTGVRHIHRPGVHLAMAKSGYTSPGQGVREG